MKFASYKVVKPLAGSVALVIGCPAMTDAIASTKRSRGTSPLSQLRIGVEDAVPPGDYRSISIPSPQN
jgi:hypothetical protein